MQPLQKGGNVSHPKNAKPLKVAINVGGTTQKKQVPPRIHSIDIGLLVKQVFFHWTREDTTNSLIIVSNFGKMNTERHFLCIDYTEERSSEDSFITE